MLGLPDEPPPPPLEAPGEEREGLDPLVRGGLAHALLESIDFARPEPPDAEAVAALAERHGVAVTADDVEDLRAIVGAFARSPLCERLAAADARPPRGRLRVLARAGRRRLARQRLRRRDRDRARRRPPDRRLQDRPPGRRRPRRGARPRLRDPARRLRARRAARRRPAGRRRLLLPRAAGRARRARLHGRRRRRARSSRSSRSPAACSTSATRSPTARTASSAPPARAAARCARTPRSAPWRPPAPARHRTAPRRRRAPWPAAAGRRSAPDRWGERRRSMTALSSAAEEQHDVGQPQPDEQDHHARERAVGGLVGREVRDVDEERERGEHRREHAEHRPRGDPLEAADLDVGRREVDDGVDQDHRQHARPASARSARSRPWCRRARSG